MHEWGLARRLLALIEDEAQARHLTKVSRVRLETGALSAAEREALCFNFETAARGTVAEAAELDIVEQAAEAMCPVCLSKVAMTHHDQACPHCQARPLTPLVGETLRITELVAT
ncbi:MAG: hydrogenase maturation nickel metallochaperone HypA [Gammaproteobacteria bacterium]|jgi:hydrogenase nickel incorporation protein HypA/HybF